MKKVAIIIVHYSGVKETKECIESIKNLQQKSFILSVVVVNNGAVEKFLPPVSVKNIYVIDTEKNLGFSGGNNIGISYALKNDADYIVILNNDTIVDKYLVENLIEVAESDKKIGIVTPKIYFAKGYEFHKDRYKKEDLGKVIWYAGGEIDWDNVIGHHKGVDEIDKGQYDSLGLTEVASGCCFLIKREVLEKVGFFNEKYFLYYEDADLSERVKKAGYTIIYAPKAILWHKNASASGGSGSLLQDYYITRNRMIFGIRYASFRTKFALIRQSIRLFFNGRQWQKKGVVDFYLRRFGKGSYK